jgi:hypothetical protein
VHQVSIFQRDNSQNATGLRSALLRKSGNIKTGSTVEVGTKTGMNEERSPEDVGGPSTTPAPVHWETTTTHALS